MGIVFERPTITCVNKHAPNTQRKYMFTYQDILDSIEDDASNQEPVIKPTTETEISNEEYDAMTEQFADALIQKIFG